MALYTPPSTNNMNVVISNTTYTPPTSNQITIDLLIITGQVPVVQNAFFLM